MLVLVLQPLVALLWQQEILGTFHSHSLLFFYWFVKISIPQVQQNQIIQSIPDPKHNMVDVRFCRLFILFRYRCISDF